MPIKEFWNEEPELLWVYRKSYMDNLKIQTETINYQAWLHGLYVYDAVSTSLYNCFGKKDNEPARTYTEQPYDLNRKPKTREERIKEERLKIEEQIRERNRHIKQLLNKGKK